MAGYDCIHCDLLSHLLTDIIPRVLKDVYGVGMNEIASTLKQTGYAVDDVGGSLNIYNMLFKFNVILDTQQKKNPKKKD